MMAAENAETMLRTRQEVSQQLRKLSHLLRDRSLMVKQDVALRCLCSWGGVTEGLIAEMTTFYQVDDGRTLITRLPKCPNTAVDLLMCCRMHPLFYHIPVNCTPCAEGASARDG